MILLIDNYDSFTYNIYQYLRKLSHQVLVKRNDAITLAEVKKLAPAHIIISPGPGRPEKAGICLELIRTFAGEIPILGICLGNQSIGMAFGGEVGYAAALFHGKSSEIFHDGRGIYSGISGSFQAVRYHSLAIQRSTLPAELEISAWTDDGEIMGVRHKRFNVEGVQFHPESIGTENGITLLANFLSRGPEASFVRAAINTLFQSKDLEENQAEKLMEEITCGQVSPIQMAAILSAIHFKGVTVAELTGFAKVLRRKVVVVAKPEGKIVIDTCGTGGDNSHTFNISTAAALVAAGAGVTVAKHGNRSITSRCGSADLLEALGINVTVPVDTIAHCLGKAGIAFLFAPQLHPALKNAGPVRQGMGVKTIFNILGPLANPAGAECQLIGVFAPELVEKVARTLLNLGVKRAMVVHGYDGLDEITLTAKTQVAEVKDGWIRTYDLDPKDYGFSYCSPYDLKGGDLKSNSDIIFSILAGEKGPKRDVTILNAAAAIYLAGQSTSYADALPVAAKAIDSQKARAKLDDWMRYSRD
jgi:anthranilate synthase/phosphoribosyltransferase